MDGGTVWNTNLAGAVDRCREGGFTDKQIVMDVIICSDAKMGAINETGNSINNFLRYWSISSFHKSVQDVAEFREAFPDL
jgi:hypothetical protein